MGPPAEALQGDRRRCWWPSRDRGSGKPDDIRAAASSAPSGGRIPPSARRRDPMRRLRRGCTAASAAPGRPCALIRSSGAEIGRWPGNHPRCSLQQLNWAHAPSSSQSLTELWLLRLAACCPETCGSGPTPSIAWSPTRSLGCDQAEHVRLNGEPARLRASLPETARAGTASAAGSLAGHKR